MGAPGFDDFYVSHFDAVARALTLAGAPRELARDATQEAFTRALRQWRRVRDMDRPDAWLYVVAMNQLRDHWRRQEREEVAAALAVDTTGAVATQLSVRDAIATLPPRQRQAVVLRYLVDLTIADVAVAMDCAVGTAKATARSGCSYCPARAPTRRTAELVGREVARSVRARQAFALCARCEQRRARFCVYADEDAEVYMARPAPVSERARPLPPRAHTPTAGLPRPFAWWRLKARARRHEASPPRPPIDDIREILATVAFIDIVQSTVHVAELGDRQWLQVLGEYHALVRSRVLAFGGREVKAVGDGSLVLFELPAQGIRCIAAIRASIDELHLEIHAGIHAGELEAFGVDVYGLAVHIAERICAQAKPNEILVSRTVKDLASGAAIDFSDRGAHTLKGVPGRWRLYAAEPRDRDALGDSQ